MWWTFFTVLVLIFALVLLIGGAFAMYFGSGKSRALGAGLLVVGLACGALYWLACKFDYLPEVEFCEVVLHAVVYLGAAIIGAAIACGIFLLAIMKV
jgi:hypothetical protein